MVAKTAVIRNTLRRFSPHEGRAAMAHNENFADKNSPPCVDERRVHTPVLTESTAFEEFDHWIDVALAGLVEQWIHTAAPNAAKQRLLGKRFEATR
jgi:hypothetical protein